MTTDERFESLEHAFASAQRRNHLMFALVVLAIGMTLAWSLVKRTPERLAPEVRTATVMSGDSASDLKRVQASAFVLVDAQGIERGGLVIDDEGPKLVLADEKGNPRIVLSEPTGPAGKWQRPLWRAQD